MTQEMASDEEDGSPMRAAASILASAAQKPPAFEGDGASLASSNTAKQRLRTSDESGGDTITHQQRWDKMFDRLKAYKDKHGNCLVPNRYAEDSQLGSWVSAQRRQYKIVTSGGNESAAMTPERAKKLKDIGFEWCTTNPRNVPWTDRFNELKDFVANYGHAEVPMRWEENPQLSNWVSKQRHQFKLMQSGRPSRLNPDRIKMLNDIGFVWEASRRRLKDGASEDGSSVSDSQLGSPKPRKVKPLSGRKKKPRLTPRNDDSLVHNLQQQAMRNLDPSFAGPARVRMDPPAALGASLAFQNPGDQPDPDVFSFPQAAAMGGMPFQNNMEFWAAQQRAMMHAGGVPGQMNPAAMFMPGMNPMMQFPGGMPMNGMGFQGPANNGANANEGLLPQNYANPVHQLLQNPGSVNVKDPNNASRPDGSQEGNSNSAMVGENWPGAGGSGASSTSGDAQGGSAVFDAEE